MNCRTCKKDITSLHYFTRNEYCCKKCEEKDDKKEDVGDLFGKCFGDSNPFK